MNLSPLHKERGTRSADRTSKIYGAIFTCLSTRPVHIELVSNLSTNNFILALCRFISRGEHPKNNFEDNGNSLPNAPRELPKSNKYLVLKN